MRQRLASLYRSSYSFKCRMFLTAGQLNGMPTSFKPEESLPPPLLVPLMRLIVLYFNLFGLLEYSHVRAHSLTLLATSQCLCEPHAPLGAPRVAF